MFKSPSLSSLLPLRSLSIGLLLSTLLLAPPTSAARVRSLLSIKNTATDNASLVISYPIEKNESGILLEETVQLLEEIAALNSGAAEQARVGFARPARET